MKLTPKIQKAINISAAKHQGQLRKVDGWPFVVHPFSVAWILSNYTKDEDVIVAGLLHDVLEDVDGYTYDDIKNDFGLKIADIVQTVSESKNFLWWFNEQADWQARKDDYLKNLKIAKREALLVSAADKINNLQSLLAAYCEHGEKVWKKFHAKGDDKLWFYNEVYKILTKRLKSGILEEYHNAIVAMQKQMNYYANNR